MSLSFDPNSELNPKISVFGVGGAGSNAVNNMINSGLEGVEFWVANTDAQALRTSMSHNKIQLGVTSTKGLGAGSNPEVGCIAAEESIEQILSALEGCHMVFITAGMGGGTGTGAAPVITRLAKEKGILTVGVVTKPFHFEGARRMKIGELGLEEMSRNIDTLIVIPNQNLFHIANERTTFADAFKMADAVLDSGIRGITDLITMPGVINLDFADIRAVMSEMGKAMMGTGEAEGENRATKAAEAAISNPLLDNSSMRGARGVLINITGSMDMTLYEVDEAANRIKEEVDPNANIIFGSAFNPDLAGRIRVSVVATGIEGCNRIRHENASSASETLQQQAHEWPHSYRQPQQNPYVLSTQHRNTQHNTSHFGAIQTQQTNSQWNDNNVNEQTAQSTTQLNIRDMHHVDPKRKEKQLVNKDSLHDITKKGGFVPPAAYEVNEYDVQQDSAKPQIAIGQNEQTSENKGLFSRMTANFSRITTSDEQKRDFIDIPAILRRNDSKNEK